jgi:hypothetical protein
LIRVIRVQEVSMNVTGPTLPDVRRRASLSAMTLVTGTMWLSTCANAGAQTIVLSAADTQVIDTTIRNGSFADANQDGPVLLTRSSTIADWERRSILSFNTTAVPQGTAIASAALTLTVKTALGAAGTTRPVAVHRLSSAFQERQATWRDRQASVPWSTLGGDLAEQLATAAVGVAAGSKVTVDLTAIVQRAINGEFSRQVMLALVDIGGGGNVKESYREYHASEASTAANRPQLTIQYASAATVVDVPAGGNLQAALDAIPPGGTIRLASGATYVGNFRLPAKGGTSVVTITTGGVTLPPPGTRIDPSYASRLATLRSPNGSASLRTNNRASYYRIVGVAIDANVGGDGDVILLGSDAQSSLTDVPHHLELDRILIRGDPSIGQRRGIQVNAAHVSILNSDIRDIKDADQESQGIAGWNTPGPIAIRNNFIEAAGENILFGGANIRLVNTVPSDITIEDNLLTKDTQWRGSSWIVKNVLELKNARRVLVRNNILEYSWAAAQNGYAVVLTPRNSSGSTPWVVVEDVQFLGNVIRHSGSVFNLLGHDDTARSGQLARVLIKDNLIYGISSGTWGGTGTFVQMGGEPRDITIDHNTVMHTGNIITFYSGIYVNSSGARVAGGPVRGFVYTNNLTRHNSYGIFGSGQSSGTATLNYYAPGAIVRRNVMATDNSAIASRYPADNQFPSFASFMASFEDPDQRDYHLVTSSAFIGAALDGKDLGCAFQ